MVPAQKILDTARKREGRHHRPLGPDHALARRDGQRRGRDGARGFRHPAAHRRRDDEPGAYGGENSSAATSAARRSTSPTRAGRSASSRACCRRRRRGRYVATIRAEYRKVADAHARAEADKQRLPLEKARANRLKIDWAALPAAEAHLHRHARVPHLRCRRARALHRLDAVLPDLGLRGRFPAIFDDAEQGAAARQLYDDAQDMLRKHRRGALVQPEGGDRLLARQRGRRRHSPLHGRKPRARRWRPSSACASSSRSATGGRTSACPISWRRLRRAGPITSARSW